MTGEGDRGVRNSHPGDLYIFIEVQKHPIFERHSADLFCRFQSALSQQHWAVILPYPL